MRLQVLGSAASEGIPAPWCECPICDEARRRGGKDIRRRTAYCLDDDTLIDFGPDAFAQSITFGVDWRRMTRLLFTHSHADHLNAVELSRRRTPRFGLITHPLKVFASGVVFAELRRTMAQVAGTTYLEDLLIEPVLLQSGERWIDRGLEIMPVRASHGSLGEETFNFILRQGDRTVLIANDTGWWCDASWDTVRNYRLDLAIVECTLGFGTEAEKHPGHLDVKGAEAFRDELVRLNAADKHTVFAVNHFSHLGGALQDRLEAHFAPRRIVTAYDGIVFDF